MADLTNRGRRRQTALYFAAAALCVIATGMYLRMNLLYPLAGDDQRNNPTNYYYITHITPLGYLKDVLDTIIRGHLETTNRCFPFAMFFGWPRYLASGSITTYRIYIIVVTCVALALNAALWQRVTKNRWFALACLSLTPLMFSITSRYDSNAFYTYHALVQQTLIWFLLAAHATVSWGRTGHWRWALIAAFFMMVCCGTYEIGYVFLAVLGFVCLILHDRFWTSVRTGLPALCGELISFVRYIIVATSEGMNGEVTVSMNVGSVVRAWFRQMSGGFPLNEMIAADSPLFIQYEAGDVIWPLLLALVAAAALWNMDLRIDRRRKAYIFCAGAVLLAGPAFLIALAGKFQDEHWLSWTHAWIPAVAESFGVALMAVIVLAAALRWLRERDRSRILCWCCLCALVTCLTGSGAWQRATARFAGLHYQQDVLSYEMRGRSMENGLLDSVPDGATVVCDYSVWGANENVQAAYLRRYTDRELLGTTAENWYDGQQHPETDALYGMGVSESTGGHCAVWMAQVQDPQSLLLSDPILYVDADSVPSDAALMYQVQDDGAAQVTVRLDEMEQSERNRDNEYFVYLNDDNIIWDSFSFVP